MIHRYWLKQYGIDGDYSKEAVRPEALPDFLRTLGERGYAGANVTLPHKQAALACADEADEAAQAIGAANTLWLEQGKLHATNTDAYGFLAHLSERCPDWNEDGRAVCVLGAGGAARAIVYGLVSAGATEIRLLNRTRERAEELAAAFRPAVRVIEWSEKDEALAGCGLLVNATSLGMEGAPPLEIALDAFPEEAVVADIVYVPLETALLRAARFRGNRTVDGLGMLLHQAVPGFAHWFGHRPEVTPELRAYVETTLAEP
jgi:shikimate dehydrogenase